MPERCRPRSDLLPYTGVELRESRGELEVPAGQPPGGAGHESIQTAVHPAVNRQLGTLPGVVGTAPARTSTCRSLVARTGLSSRAARTRLSSPWSEELATGASTTNWFYTDITPGTSRTSSSIECRRAWLRITPFSTTCLSSPLTRTRAASAPRSDCRRPWTAVWISASGRAGPLCAVSHCAPAPATAPASRMARNAVIRVEWTGQPVAPPGPCGFSA